MGSKAEDKGKRENSQAEYDRVKNKRNRNYEGDSGGRRRMLSLLQEAIEDAAAAVVAIATKLDLRDPGQYLNPEEVKAPVIEKNRSKRNSGGRDLQVQRRG